jgi:hypothetical protein
MDIHKITIFYDLKTLDIKAVNNNIDTINQNDMNEKDFSMFTLSDGIIIF